MDNTGNVTENGQQDVDEKVCTATTLEENADGRKEDGKNDLDDVAGRECVSTKSKPHYLAHIRCARRVSMDVHSRSGESHCISGL